MATTKAQPTGLHVLSVRQVLAADAGDLNDGGGLFLRVGRDRGSWVKRYTALTVKRREMGLGVAYRDSLPQAGDSLTAARDFLRRRGRDGRG